MIGPFEGLPENPWASIMPGPPPHLHPPDLPQIEAHNNRVGLDHELHLDVYPEPYIGDPAAPILLLNLNPGYRNRSWEAHAHPRVAELCVANLRHATDPDGLPFYPLRPDYQELCQSRWWESALQGWIAEFGREVVARSFFCVEYFPYASRYYKPVKGLLPSQEYSFALVKKKIEAGCLVVAMRHARQWVRILGVTGDHWIRRKTDRQKSLNPPRGRQRGNLKPEDAERIRMILGSA